MSTVLFLLLSVSLALLAGLVLAVAMRRARRQPVDRQRVNVAIYRERAAELDAERAAGRLDDAQHAALLGELQRMLVDDVDVGAGSDAGVAAQTVAGKSPLLLVPLVPALAVGIYLVTGFDAETRNWLQLVDRTTEVAALPQPLTEATVAPAGLSLLDAARLTQATLPRRAADADAWFRLGITWLELETPMLAVESLRTARRLAPERTDITIALARVELALNRGQLNDEIRALFDAVLAQEPAHQGLLMVYGMAAFDSGDFAMAAQRWEQLLALIDPKSEGAGLLRQSIARARERAAAAANSPGIPVRVVFSQALGTPPADATLFVVVRAAGGPAMPIAAKKLAPRFPAEVTITDADQMMPGAPLASRGPLEVRARLSLSGTPMPAAGDMESAPVQVVFPLDAPVTLTLDKRLP